ncbi:MAG: lipase family protein [Clostridia bacterium]|nr:lipase family protein [Clostridia bacterium]
MTLHKLFSVCLHIPYSQVGKSANYAVKRENGTLYIFFQGSDGKNDWKNNLDFPVKPYKRMGKTIWFAHRGFLRTWKELEPFLYEKIVDRTVEKVVIAGYSHGGALAMLCHEYVWYHRPDLRATTEGYGFGAPRVFWGAQTAELKSRWEKFTVIRNLDDLVTHLPPAFLGFSHVGELLNVGKKGKYSSIQAHFPQNILTELQAYDNKTD